MNILHRIVNTARRTAGVLLCVTLLFGVSLTLTQPAEAASWMDPYLNQMKEWGVMKGDANGNLHGERVITRAEFVTLVNRAFGYREMGENPFKDVPNNAWYANDIRIAYKAGYFQGSSPTTASPYASVTREQAVVLIGRSLRMQNTPGYTLDYQDSSRIGHWSRGIIHQATEMGIIGGYADGTFRPKQAITRGQAASILARAIGTLVNQSGEQDVGNVYGNLTITAPGVTLSNTVVTGNLYLTGGIGLDDVVLNNVTVGGKIVVCGTGASQKGESSVILRNVTANGLEIDSMTNQYLSVRAEGLTSIKDTVARTSSYIEDLTADGKGLSLIKLDGAVGAQFQLAGNIKEVINRSPASFLGIGGGVANKVTVDERATGSTLDIGANGTVRDLNLDTAATVTGKGDITNATVNATGSTIPMLPDTIVVRPGVTGNIGGTVMDSAAAIESSEDPRLLAGYPAARNVAPTSADAVFSANKSGTIYWAVTALTDGSVNETVLLNPATSHSAVKSGKIKVAASKTELTAKLSGLTKDGSYYISAMLVDARGRHSPVKVTAFTTPDDTVPAFATGYPYTNMTFSKTDTTGKEQIVQAMVMPTKDCRLYYALLPKGSVAPTAANFKTGSITGNLGYGVVDVKKNTPLLIPRVNTAYLKEETTYDLYLWLNDADNGKSSAVKKLSVTTLDMTPPVLQSIRVSDVAARSVSVTFSVNEPATLYWAVVKHGADFLSNGADKNTQAAKIQIESGVGALKKGSANAAKAATDVKFTVSGLEGQSAYDLYYVVKDKAGNYNVYTEEFGFPLVLNTLDNEPPTVKQEFTHDGTDSGKLPTPYPDTSIRLVFSESVMGKTQNGSGGKVYNNFMELYKASLEDPAKKAALADALRTHIKLYARSATGQITQVPERTAANAADWVIDYRYATVTLDADSGEMIVTFPHNTKNPDESAINLSSGVTYYFELSGIVDTSVAENAMVGSRGVTKLPEFTTIDAQLQFMRGTSSGTMGDGTNLVFDMNFRVNPITTSSVSDDIVWDLLFWSEQNIAFKLYSRDAGDANEKWTQVGTGEVSFTPTTQDPTIGVSLTRSLSDLNSFEKLNGFTADREYGIIVTRFNGSIVRNDWSGTASLKLMAVSGDPGSMTALANTHLTPENYKKFQSNSNTAVREIGKPTEYSLFCPFVDQNSPTFVGGYPIFEAGDTSAQVKLQLNRNNTKYYYVIAPVESIPTTVVKMPDGTTDGLPTTLKSNNWNTLLPKDGQNYIGETKGNVSNPPKDNILNPPYSGPDYAIKSAKYSGGLETITVRGLKPSTKYVAYFVLQGESQESISDVYAFGFETKAVERPIIGVDLQSPGALLSSDRDAVVSYVLLVSTQPGNTLNQPFNDANLDKNAIGSEEYKEYWDDSYKTKTLWEAMQIRVNSGGNKYLGTVFDLFASTSAKDSVSNFITSGASAGSSFVAKGTVRLETGKLQEYVEFKDLTVGMSYILVATGKSELGSGYAFCSNYYLTKADTEPPKVNSLSTAHSKTNLNATPSRNTWFEKSNDAINASYTGELSIAFDKPLYLWVDPTTRKQIVNQATYPDTDNKYAALSSILDATDSVKPVHLTPGSTAPCSSLKFEYTSIKSGTTLHLSNSICDENGNKATVTLNISLQLVKNSEGLYSTEFKIDSGSAVWDGTGGSLTNNSKK